LSGVLIADLREDNMLADVHQVLVKQKSGARSRVQGPVGSEVESELEEEKEVLKSGKPL
jgi:hypothetical protein